MSSLTLIGQKITIYGGFAILITGVIGGLINIIVFLSLKTFRQNSCAFYLIIMSIVNIGQLLFGLLSRILITGFDIDWTLTSLFFSTMDQYFATCTRPRWQQWSNIKIAHRLTIISTIISCIILIPYPIYLNNVKLATGKMICTTTNDNVSQYRSYFVPLVAAGYLPDFITVLFGSLAYRNVRQIAYRTVPLVRRELDKQLTVMVLVQVVINLFTNVPCVTINAIVYGTSYIKDLVILERIQFIYSVAIIIFYLYFASSFYIYICVSERFRRQLFYVFYEIHRNRCRRQGPAANQIAPS